MTHATKLAATLNWLSAPKPATSAMIGTTCHTERQEPHLYVVTTDGDVFRTYRYENSVGAPKLIGTGHDIRSALAFVKLHKGTRR